jgi:sigma-B regulation protein RsbU (phosphoserine phosphatase)
MDTAPRRRPDALHLLLILAAFGLCLVASAWPIRLIGQPFAGARIEPTLTVSAVNDGAWPAMKAGLHEYDRIVAVNGRPVRHNAELYDLVRQAGIGQTVTYTVRRPGAVPPTLTVDVAIRAFGWRDLQNFGLIFLIGFAHLVIGAVAFMMKSDSLLARVHLYMTIAVGLSLVLTNDYDFGVLFPRVWFVACAMAGATCLHLGLLFPEPRRFLKDRKWPVPLIYGFAALVCAAWQLTYQPVGAVAMGDAAMDRFFIAYQTTMIWGAMGPLGLLILLVTAWRTASSPRYKTQAKVTLFGATTAYGPMLLLWMLPVFVLGISLDASGQLVLLTALCWLIFPISIAYAIVRHQLFDIDVIIKLSMLYSSLVVLLGGGYMLGTAVIQQALIAWTGSASDFANLAMTGAIAVVFDPMRQRLRELIDRRFFRAKYDFKRILSDFAAAARSTIRVDDLIESMRPILETALHPSHIALYLRRDRLIVRHAAFGDSTGMPLVLPAQHALDKLPRAEGARHFPLTVSGKDGVEQLVGILALGPKRSELDYTHEDVQLLTNMAQQFALTVHNAELATEVAEKAAIQRSLEQARMIQRSMLPDQQLDLPSHQVVGYSESTDETGGDYYDWAPLTGGRYVVAVGDVTGHGIDAALIVAMAKACLFNQLRDDPTPGAVMAALNETIHAVDSRRTSEQNRKLMSCVYALVDPEQGTMDIASAGHFYPLVYRAAAGAVEDLSELQSTFPLGTRPPAKFKCPQGVVGLGDGDVLLFFTDGVHEAHDDAGQEYGLERLQDQLVRLHDLPAAEIQQALLDDLYGHIGQSAPVEDDVTVLVIKVAPAAGPA